MGFDGMAWRSLSKVYSHSFLESDIIIFERYLQLFPSIRPGHVKQSDKNNISNKKSE